MRDTDREIPVGVSMRDCYRRRHEERAVERRMGQYSDATRHVIVARRVATDASLVYYMVKHSNATRERDVDVVG
jgi:hypothetical protein